MRRENRGGCKRSCWRHTDAATAAIAGGQSLLPMLNLRVALPDIVVDLGGLEELKEVSVSSGSVRIGALTTHAEIEDGLFADAFDGLAAEGRFENLIPGDPHIMARSAGAWRWPIQPPTGRVA